MLFIIKSKNHRNDTQRNYNYKQDKIPNIFIFSFFLFFFKTSIIQIVTSDKASVNMTLLEFSSKSTTDWNKSYRISEIIPKINKCERYFHLFRVLKKLSTRKNEKSGNAIRSRISKRSLICCEIPFSVKIG